MKIMLFKTILCLFFLTMCAPKQEAVQEEYAYTELDRGRMEQIVLLMPVILRKAQEFQSRAVNVSDEDYNSEYYKYLYSEKAFADRLAEAGFANPDELEEFYSEMINIYVLLSEQPYAVNAAEANAPVREREVSGLLLRAAAEPNNPSVARTLQKYQYELASYRNILVVDEFMPRLKEFNEQ